MHVLATAGHVDHGKSTLVHALTGIDPDRLAEEKARGLTIDLGFAWTTLPSGHGVAFVDVPGHVRFIKNMLAGVGAVDGCLFVVAATEGWKPQSEEHLRILDLLGVRGGVVALTKCALVDDDRRGEVAALVRQRLAGSVLERAAIVPTDVPLGAGLAELKVALDDLLERTPVAEDRGRPRLWIDRCFAAPGAGTVVTGTLAGGRVLLHDELHVVPGPAPEHRPIGVRVRALQTHGRSRAEVAPGQRVALGLLGLGGGRLARAAIGRGQAVVRLSQWAPATTFDASLRVLAEAPAPLGRRGALQLYVGSGEHAVRLRVLGGPAIEPGGLGLVRIHLPVPLALLPGDRFVLRDAGRALTVGGGEVLELSPVSRVSRARPDRSVDRVIAERGWIEVDDLERLTGVRRAPSAGRWVVDPGLLATARERLLAAVERAGDFGLELGGLDERDRVVATVLAGEGAVVIRDGRARCRAGPDLAASALLAALDASPFAPPDVTAPGVDRAELRELMAAGLVLERDGRHFSAEAVRRGSRIVQTLLERSPQGVTVSAVREALGTTRKHVLPFLALLDAEGITRRRGDVRIAGPRLGDVASADDRKVVAPASGGGGRGD